MAQTMLNLAAPMRLMRPGPWDGAALYAAIVQADTMMVSACLHA